MLLTLLVDTTRIVFRVPDRLDLGCCSFNLGLQIPNIRMLLLICCLRFQVLLVVSVDLLLQRCMMLFCGELLPHIHIQRRIGFILASFCVLQLVHELLQPLPCLGELLFA